MCVSRSNPPSIKHSSPPSQSFFWKCDHPVTDTIPDPSIGTGFADPATINPQTSLACKGVGKAWITRQTKEHFKP